MGQCTFIDVLLKIRFVFYDCVNVIEYLLIRRLPDMYSRMLLRVDLNES